MDQLSIMNEENLCAPMQPQRSEYQLIYLNVTPSNRLEVGPGDEGDGCP